MRKLMYILIGLVMVAIAISLAGYRHVYEPRARTARAPDASISSRSLARPETSTRSAQPATRAPSTPSGTSVTSIANFATVIDVLNVIVGVVGIILALMGMRMQRQAMAMQSARTEEGRR